MEFLQNLGKRVLIAVDNHPRVVAGAALVFMLLVHPALVIVGAVAFTIYAYIANEAKK